MKKSIFKSKFFTMVVFISLCSIAPLSYAGIGVCHDGAGSITRIEQNADAVYFSQTANCVYASIPPYTDAQYQALRSLVSSVPQKYLKWNDGLVEMTQAEKDALDQAEVIAETTAVRERAKSRVVGFSDDPLYQRALADILKDEINALRARDRDRASDIALATNLANLQTRAAQRPALEDRTLNQLKTAIQNRIDSGSVDA